MFFSLINHCWHFNGCESTIESLAFSCTMRHWFCILHSLYLHSLYVTNEDMQLQVWVYLCMCLYGNHETLCIHTHTAKWDINRNNIPTTNSWPLCHDKYTKTKKCVYVFIVLIFTTFCLTDQWYFLSYNPKPYPQRKLFAFYLFVTTLFCGGSCWSWQKQTVQSLITYFNISCFSSIFKEMFSWN